MRKNCVLSVLAIIILTACVTTQPYEPYSYEGTQALYPAVYMSIAEDTSSMFKNVVFDAVDINKNSYEMKGVAAVDGLLLSSFTINLEKPSSELQYSVKDIYQRAAKGEWRSVSKFLIFNPESIYAYLNNQIKAIVESPELYDIAKEKALSDLSFLTAIVSNMTDIQLKGFLQNELVNTTISTKASVIEVIENTNTNYKDYQYKLSLSIDATPEGEFQNEGFSKQWVFIDFYTNDSKYANVSKKTVIDVSGQVVDFFKSDIVRHAKGTVVMIEK